MTELSVEHVLLFVIAAYLLYNLTSGCNDGFNVGGQGSPVGGQGRPVGPLPETPSMCKLNINCGYPVCLNLTEAQCKYRGKSYPTTGVGFRDACEWDDATTTCKQSDLCDYTVTGNLDCQRNDPQNKGGSDNREKCLKKNYCSWDVCGTYLGESGCLAKGTVDECKKCAGNIHNVQGLEELYCIDGDIDKACEKSIN